MFTRQFTEDEDPLPDAAPLRGDSGVAEITEALQRKEWKSAAKQRHSEVVSETRWLMIEWIILLSINFVMHYMRMSIVMLYCIERFGASEFDVGLMVTIHMLLMGLANSYVCFVMDNYSFESLMTVRFGLLTLATIGEYFADSFVLFASIYSLASFAVVWLGVQSAYCVQMLPSEDAKSLTNIGLMLNQTGIVLGLAIGGLIGGLIDKRSVFLVSFIVSLLTLMWIVFILRGKEARMKRVQVEEIAGLYRDFPVLFGNANKRFPIAFRDRWMASQRTNTDSNSDSMMKTSLLNSNSPNVAADSASAAAGSVPVLERQRSQEGSMGDYYDDFLYTFESLPFWVLTIRFGIQTASITEILCWWNVYSSQVYDAPLEQSSLQFVIAIIIGILVSVIVLRISKPQQMEFGVLLNLGVSLTLISSVLTALLFFFVFPHLRFSHFWLGLIIFRGLFGLTWPYPNTLQVAESPAQSAGKMFAVLTASRSIIPAIQHVIIGRLWSVGGANHPWFFRWFGILHLCNAFGLLVYFVMRKCIIVESEAENKYFTVTDR